MKGARDLVGRWPRVILHADMDAFYAAVEQLDDPALRGKPVLVGGTSLRGVVSTASYEARPFGVGSAMPMAEARRRCPDAVVVPPRFERYQEISARVMAVFDSYSPLVEPLSLDEAFLDMTGSEGIFGEPARMGASLRQDVFEATDGLRVSVGISTTKYVAKVASDHDKPDGLTIVPEEEVLDFLWPLPVGRLWGVGARTRSRLEAMGLHTIGDVARASRPALEARFGVMGEHIHRLSRGDDSRDVVGERGAKSVGAEYTLERDVLGRDEILPHLRRSTQKVGRRLRRAGLVASGIRVKLKTADFRLHSRQSPLRPPTASTKTLLERATALLADFDLSVPMRLVGMAAFNLRGDREPAQGELFADEEALRRQRLDRALDSLADRFGEEVVHRGYDPKEVGERRSPDSPEELAKARLGGKKPRKDGTK